MRPGFWEVPDTTMCYGNPVPNMRLSQPHRASNVSAVFGEEAAMFLLLLAKIEPQKIVVHEKLD